MRLHASAIACLRKARGISGAETLSTTPIGASAPPVLSGAGAMPLLASSAAAAFSFFAASAAALVALR